MADSQAPSSPSSRRIGALEDNVDKRNAKSCNCKKSNCLKLYCECFANGVYCQVGKCNCVSCQNNFDNNSSRRLAVEATLERNPNSFRSKMFISDKSNDKSGKNTSSKVHKGCHCKKSNCLKKYCECFQAGIVCTDRCRCMACKNFEGSTKRIEAAARVELKEKQAMLEMQHNNDLMNQRANATASGVTAEQGQNDSYLVDRSLPSTSSSSSAVARDRRTIATEEKYQDITFLSDDNIRSACELLHKRSRENISDNNVTQKQKIEVSADITPGEVSVQVEQSVSPSDTEDQTKQIMLDVFSEHLRQLIVQSLASKISENNNYTSAASSIETADQSTLGQKEQSNAGQYVKVEEDEIKDDEINTQEEMESSVLVKEEKNDISDISHASSVSLPPVSLSLQNATTFPQPSL